MISTKVGWKCESVHESEHLIIRSLKRFIQNTDSFTNETQLQRMRSSVSCHHYDVSKMSRSI